MKGKFLNTTIFVLSLICLLVLLKLFWNMGVYVDNFNTSPDVVLGGKIMACYGLDKIRSFSSNMCFVWYKFI